MARYNIILVPEGAIIPEELRFSVIPKGDIVGRIAACEGATAIMPVSSRELQILVEYRDLLDVDVQAVVGLHGAMYNTIWNTYVSTMKRTTVDTLLAQQQEANDRSAVAGQSATTTERTRAAAVRHHPDFAEQPVQGQPDDDATTGDIE